MAKPTSFTWQLRDLGMTVEMSNVLTPEAIETVLTRTRREFVASARQLGMGADIESVEAVEDGG